MEQRAFTSAKSMKDMAASGLGFSLAEVAAHLDSPRDHTRKSRLLSKMEDKIRDLDYLLADLQSRRTTLVSLAAELRKNIARDQ